LDGRRNENAKSMLAAFEAYKTEEKLTFTTKTSDHAAQDGSTYKELDPQKTITSNPGLAQDVKDTITGFTDK
jgi:hypothetical protein